MIAAVRGALGFLTRFPVGNDEAAFDAFRSTPAAFPLVGYAVGLVLTLPFVVPLPTPTAAFALVVTVALVTGVNHADGLADLGDAAVVHGDPARRREVMSDTTVGVGALLALGIDFVGLTLAGLALAGVPLSVTVGLVVASEVGAKLAMALLVCRASASHEGFGSSFLDRADSGDLWLPVLVVLPAGVLAAVTATTVAALATLLSTVLVALAVQYWADAQLDGVGGDVFGAANELARIAALHAGVIAWTLW